MPVETWVVLSFDKAEKDAAVEGGSDHEFAGIHGVSVHDSGEAATRDAKALQASSGLVCCVSKLADRRDE